MNQAKKIILTFLKSLRLSVLASQFGSVSQCYHYPTCGDYTLNQIRQVGPIGGLLRGLKRSLGCIFLPSFKKA